MSRLPPQLDGGTIECCPGSGRATPIVPGKGSNGSVTPSANPTRRALASTAEMRSHGSGNSSASSPKPGMIAVQPQSPGRSSRISTASTSPGFASFTNTGPLHRVHVREVERRHGVGARVTVDLLVAGVADVQLDLRAGRDLEGRWDRVVPHVVERLGPDLVQRMTVHRRPLPQ